AGLNEDQRNELALGNDALHLARTTHVGLPPAPVPPADHRGPGSDSVIGGSGGQAEADVPQDRGSLDTGRGTGRGEPAEAETQRVDQTGLVGGGEPLGL